MKIRSNRVLRINNFENRALVNDAYERRRIHHFNDSNNRCVTVLGFRSQNIFFSHILKAFHFCTGIFFSQEEVDRMDEVVLRHLGRTTLSLP